MVEGRDFRSPNTMPDGPDKTIWGAEQKAWFKRTVEASDAAFRVLISPTPVIGPDRERKNDNHANEGFTHEGNELRQFIAEQKNMVVVTGTGNTFLPIAQRVCANILLAQRVMDMQEGGLKTNVCPSTVISM
jgi:phosphodiesterase/alkaline phosphatase D-like protein